MKLLAAIYKDGSQFLFHRALNCVKTVADAPLKPVYWEMMLNQSYFWLSNFKFILYCYKFS